MPKVTDKEYWRIMDANFNRAKEGLRVCEDICRFVWELKGPTRQFKQLRHQVGETVLPLGKKNLLASRDIAKDIGRRTLPVELKRAHAADIFYANVQRVKESIRVLEEVAKLLNAQKAEDLKKIRYKVYAVEKKVAQGR